MASKFNVWIDDSQVGSSNMIDLTDDSQKKEGFKPGIAASSARVNTMLRETSLVSKALMNLVDSTGVATYASSVDVVQALIRSYFNSFVKNTRKVAGKTLQQDVALGTLEVKVNGTSVGEYDGSQDKTIDLTDIVKTDETQTIDGPKTFTQPVVLKISDERIILSDGFIVRGETGSQVVIGLPVNDGTIALKQEIKLYRHDIVLSLAGDRISFIVLSFTDKESIKNADENTLNAFFKKYVDYLSCSGQFHVGSNIYTAIAISYNFYVDNKTFYLVSEAASHQVVLSDTTVVFDTVTTLSLPLA